MKAAENLEAGALPLGFRWGAATAGIKASGRPDLACCHVSKGAVAAAMFTRNQVVAAPIMVGRRHLAATGGRVSAVLVNAGNANCATGEPGLEAATDSCRAAAEQLGCLFDEVFPSSTGIIGVPFPTAKLLAALPALAASLGTTPAHTAAFADAILTTDTRRKVASAVIAAGSREIRIFGVAKGAGMLHPHLEPAAGLGAAALPHATMLVYLFTDLQAEREELDALLAPAVDGSFHTISVDGDTSTNDTVLLLASGATGVRLDDQVGPPFAEALNRVCRSLAHQIVADGEGARHVVTLEILGAETEDDALAVAEAIARSPLNKTAWSSADPNWGRLLAAAGAAGVPFDPARLRLAIGDQIVFEHGLRAAGFDEATAHATMQAPEYTITVDLGEGTAHCRYLTCDLTEEYVRINADYAT